MGKSIVQKLNLQKYKKTAVLNLPEGATYFEELAGYDKSLAEDAYDMIFVFVLDMQALREIVEYVIERKLLQVDGYLFAAYPKKGNKVYPTYIHRDDLFSGLGADEHGVVGDSDVRFSRMVGLDDVFTVVGFKREVKGKRQPTAKASQRADDYIERIPDVEKALLQHPELLAFYKSLSPGYRKDWARYVYSPKQEATREKRREEMIHVLEKGYKSIDLFRRAQR